MLRFTAIAIFAAAAVTAPEPTARELYHEGLARMRANDLREAESSFIKAARTNHDAVQPVATYNLGHVRFLQGKEMLSGEGNRQQILDGGQAATALAQEVLRSGRAALLMENKNVRELISAYNDARAARKELRTVRDQTNRAFDLLGSTLRLWRKSANSFFSAHELDAANADAKFNGDVVERRIDELLKFQEMMQQQAEGAVQKRKELSELMKELRGKIPKEFQREGEGEDEEDQEEEGEEKEKKDDKKGPNGEKQQQRLGGERMIDPEVLKMLKEKLKTRGMSPEGMQRDPRSRNGRDW